MLESKSYHHVDRLVSPHLENLDKLFLVCGNKNSEDSGTLEAKQGSAKWNKPAHKAVAR